MYFYKSVSLLKYSENISAFNVALIKTTLRSGLNRKIKNTINITNKFYFKNTAEYLYSDFREMNVWLWDCIIIFIFTAKLRSGVKFSLTAKQGLIVKSGNFNCD